MKQSIAAVILCVMLCDRPGLPNGLPHSVLGEETQTLPELREAIERDPSKLVGYTLFGPSGEERAMVLNLRTGHSFEILPGLQVPKRVEGDTYSYFVGWLPDHKRAIVQVGNWKLTADDPGFWMDQFIVDFELGRFFSPTVAGSPEHFNAGMIPYMTRENSAAGYMLDIQNPLDKKKYGVFTMSFDGSQLHSFPLEGSNDVGSHGCQPSPKSAFVWCEVFGKPSALFWTDGKPIRDAGPTFFGPAMWSPNGQRFIYFGPPDPPNPAVSSDIAGLVLIYAPTGKSCSIGGKLMPDGCGGGLRFVHNFGPGHHMTDIGFMGGSDLGQWSADGDAFYVSIVLGSGRTVHNAIGRVETVGNFDFLTPEEKNARTPALAPAGSSFVYVAGPTFEDGLHHDAAVEESLVQLFLHEDGEKPRQITHLPPGWAPTDPKWREATGIAVPGIPQKGPGTGSFRPVNCCYCGV